MRRYDLLLVDADNTLLDFDAAERGAFAETCQAMGLTPAQTDAAAYSAINEALWRALERGETTLASLRVQRFERYLAHVGAPSRPNAERMNTLYAALLGRQGQLLPGAAEAVARWRSILPVVMVTNGIGETQRGRLAACGLLEALDGLIISEEIGFAKPDARVIEAAMRLQGAEDRARVLMLGDSLTSDIAAAANAGIDACWFNPKGKENGTGLPVRYTIARLDEVDAILLGEAI